MKIALLIVDMQEIFLRELKEKLNIDRTCEYINFVAEQLRKHGHLVVHIRDVEGIEEAEDKSVYREIPEIRVDPRDLTSTKVYANAFWQTDLERILKDNEAGLVIVSGFAAEHCVLFTYNGAIERGFKAVILHNGIASTNPDIVQSTYRDRNLISYPAVEFMLTQLAEREGEDAGGCWDC